MAQRQTSNELFDYNLFPLFIGPSITQLYIRVLLHDSLKFRLVLIGKFAFILQRKPSEKHLVLSKGASFIRQQVFYPAQLFRNITVSGNGAFNLLILVYLGGVHELSEVQVDSHGDRDDRAQQNEETNELGGYVFEVGRLQQDNH